MRRSCVTSERSSPSTSLPRPEQGSHRLFRVGCSIDPILTETGTTRRSPRADTRWVVRPSVLCAWPMPRKGPSRVSNARDGDVRILVDFDALETTQYRGQNARHQTETRVYGYGAYRGDTRDCRHTCEVPGPSRRCQGSEG